MLEHLALTLLSFPKCGRTWTICMLAQVLNNTLPLDESDVLLKSKGLKYFHGEGMITDGHPFASTPNGVLNPHEASTRLKHKFCYPYVRPAQPVVVITRDPRDVLVSTYYEQRFRDPLHKYSGNLSSFIRGSVGSLSTILAWQSTLHGALLSLPSACRRSFLVVSYESLKACAACSLRRILCFLGHRPDNHIISTAVARCGFGSLKALNSTNPKWGVFGAGPPESNKVRAGIVGGYTRELQGEDLQFVEEALRLHGAAIWTEDAQRRFYRSRPLNDMCDETETDRAIEIGAFPSWRMEPGRPEAERGAGGSNSV